MFHQSHKYIFVDWDNLALKVLNDCTRKGENSSNILNYSIVKKLFSLIKKIGIDDKDVVFICANSNGSWRSSIDKSWKYKNFPHSSLFHSLEKSTPFFTLMIPNMESRDLISYGVRNFCGEKIIISSQKDFEQLSAENIKIFSPYNSKYKIIKNNLNNLLNKIKDIKVKSEYEKKFLIENLCSLPEYIDEKIREHINSTYGSNLTKIYHSDLFPFKSLALELDDIYRRNKVVKVSKSFKKKRKKLEVLSLF